MAYDEQEYLNATTALDEAVATLLSNDIPEGDIIQLVRDALENAR